MNATDKTEALRLFARAFVIFTTAFILLGMLAGLISLVLP